jgi:hypothetical protein
VGGGSNCGEGRLPIVMTFDVFFLLLTKDTFEKLKIFAENLDELSKKRTFILALLPVLVFQSSSETTVKQRLLF